MTITPHIFEAYLKCRMKCWLLSSGKPPSRNIYYKWFQAKTEFYRIEEANRLLTQTPSGEYATVSCGSRSHGTDTPAENLKAAKWQLAVHVFLCANGSQVPNGLQQKANSLSDTVSQNVVTTDSAKQDADHRTAWRIEARIHALERVPPQERGKPCNLSKFDLHSRISSIMSN